MFPEKSNLITTPSSSTAQAEDGFVQAGETSIARHTQSIAHRADIDIKPMSSATSTNFLQSLELLQSKRTTKELDESIMPSEAASILRYVRKNNTILLAQEEIYHQKVLQELMTQLVLQHKSFLCEGSSSRNLADFFKPFQNKAADAGIGVNDLFIHAFGRGLIDQKVCYEGLIGYAFFQEFSNDQTSMFHSSSRIHHKRTLEIKPQEGSVIQQGIFEKNGQFSQKGAAFIEGISKNLVEMNYTLGASDGLGEFRDQTLEIKVRRIDAMIQQLTQKILLLPEEGQFFYEVSCHPKKTYEAFQLYWQKLIEDNEITPLILASKRVSNSDIFNFQLSSFHILMEICQGVNFTGQEIDLVKPEICLGLVGEKTHTKRLMEKNSHISSYLDVRAKNNLVMVHNFHAGPAIALVHDLYFHLLIENKMAPTVRNLVLRDFPNYMDFIRVHTSEQNREIKPHLKELSEDFKNIDYYDIGKLPTEMDQALYVLRVRVGNSEHRINGPRFVNASNIIFNSETVARFIETQSADMTFFKAVMDAAR